MSRTNLSKILEHGESREIGRYEAARVGGLPGLGSGIIVEVFHKEGIEFNLMDWLNRAHKALTPSGPRCFR